MQALQKSLFLFLVSSSFCSALQAGTPPTVVDGTFKVSAPNYYLWPLALEADGKIIIGMSGNDQRVARLNADGSWDTGFQPPALDNHFEIRNVAMQPDGRLLLAEGAYYYENGGEQAHAKLVRLNSNGIQDVSFQPVLTSTDLPGSTLGVLALPDGRSFINGGFQGVNGIGEPGVAILKANGQIDPSFEPAGFHGKIRTVALQGNGSLLVGGAFDSVQGSSQTNLVRLRPDGQVDPEFLAVLPQTNRLAAVDFFLVQSDGRILVAGWVQGSDFQTILRLTSDGRLDTSFGAAPEVQIGNNLNLGEPDPQHDWEIASVLLQNDGKILVGGYYSVFSGGIQTAGSYRILRLNPDGSLDRNLNAALELAQGATESPLLTQTDGLLIGTVTFPEGSASPSSGLGRFFSDGAIPGVGFSRGDYSVNESAGEATIDVTRTGDPSQPLSVNYRTADGSAVAGTNYIARSGTLHFGSFEQTQTLHLPLLDDALVKGNQTVHLSLSSPSPGVVLSGFAQAILTIQDHEIPTTLLDPDFVPPAFGSGGNYETILPLSDGTILAGGVFSSSTGNSFSGAFLRPDGSAASTFRPALGLPGNLEIRALALQPDGSRLVAGFTDSDNGMSRTMFRFRMQPDGTLDGNGTSKLSSTNQWGGVSVSAMLFQPDGKLVVGGTFGFANQQKQAGLARFNPDGSTDESFDGGGGLLIHTATADERPGTANWLALQPDGKMLVAGFFTSLHGFSINNLARLNPDGSVDPSFVPSYLADGRVAGPVALQADGKVISAAGGSLVRLNSDGILDPSFQFNSEGVTEFAALAVAPDGRILASAGFYDTAQGNTTNRLLIVRADGSIELGQEMVFQDGGVTTISFDRNGRILVGGTFSAVNGAPRAGIARLLADGVGKPAVQFAVSDVLVGEDGGTATVTVLRTGNATGPLSVDFTTASGSAKAGVAFTPQSGTLQFGPLETRKTITIPIHDDLAVESNVQFRVILTNAANGVVLGGGPSAEVITIYDAERPGAVDFSFNPTIGGRVRAVAPQPDGKVLVSLFGNITNSLTGQLTSLFRLQSDGQVDSSFQAVLRFRLGGGAELDYPSSIVDALALQPNGKILVGGILSATNAASGQSNLPRIVRLNPNGTPDPDFHIPAIPDGEVQAVAIQSDGKIVIGGTFSMVDDVIRIGLARLTADGQVDTSFDGGTSFGGVPQLPFVWIPALVDTILVQADGKILIGGSFTNYQGVIRNGLVRINADASIDATLNPGDGPAISSTSPALVTSILDLPDGRKLVGGNFESWNGQARPGLARLNGDGTLDASFPHDLFLGTLGNYNQGIQLALQSDGRVLIANNDDFYATKSPINRANIARLNLDGTLDPSFDPGSGSGCCGRSIAALAVLPNGQILVAGDFASFDEVPRLGLVHLHGDPPLHIAAIAAGSNDDDAQLTLSALPKRSYVLEASANLTTWLPVRTNIATGYSLKFSDSEAMGWPLRFYRARQSVP